MSTLVIQFNVAEDIRPLEQLAKQLGLTFFQVSGFEKRLYARESLLSKRDLNQEVVEIPDGLIDEVIEEIRTARNEKN
jgi:hypothetical protein